MIESFSDKQTEKLWKGQRTRFPSDLIRRALDKLTVLHFATTLNDLRVPPSNHLESLSGDRAGQGSTAFVLISNGVSASSGTKVTPLMSRYLTITK